MIISLCSFLLIVPMICSHRLLTRGSLTARITPMKAENAIEKSFAFVINKINVQANLPFEIVPKHFFQRADAKQVETIKKRLRLFGSSERHDGVYERIDVSVGNPQAGNVRTENLPQESWRYWVVTFEGTSSAIPDIEVAFSLLRNEVRFGFTHLAIEGGGQGLTWSSGPMSIYTNQLAYFEWPEPTIVESELRDVTANYSTLMAMKEQFPNIYQAAHRFHQLKNIPEFNHFLVIGYFSVIESLITHAPELTEPMDSLTHQVKTKMNLLIKKFQRPLVYGDYFKITDGDKVWTRLYGYRSKLAHGDTADFNNQFKDLKSPKDAMRFLNEAAKLLILYAMREPQLITDLKKC